MADRFVFGAGSHSSAGPDLVVTSSNSGLPGQEGLDRTAVDFQQFTMEGAGGAGIQADTGDMEEGELEGEEGGVS